MNSAGVFSYDWDIQHTQDLTRRPMTSPSPTLGLGCGSRPMNVELQEADVRSSQVYLLAFITHI